MASDVGIDNITLAWSEPKDTDVEYYEIKSKQTGEMKWCKTSVSTDDAQTHFRMENLCQDTEYEFKVRPNYGDYEGEFSEKSEPIKTKQSHALKMLELPNKLFEEQRTQNYDPGMYYNRFQLAFIFA